MGNTYGTNRDSEWAVKASTVINAKTLRLISARCPSRSAHRPGAINQ